MAIQNKTLKQILQVNRAFYDAFAAGDFLTVKQTWSKSDQISVIHPGSVALHGHKAVMASWELIFENSGSHDIKCINERVYLAGESAYVVCNEVFPEGQLVATNIFVIENGLWRMVHHQAGPCPDSGQGDDSLSNEDLSNESPQGSSTLLH
jgi:ketosteroid isomerase-like protein